MENVSVDSVDTQPGPADVRRPLSRALGADNLALNYFELAPGDAFGFGYHRHPSQEEVFYVQAGTATFETEDGDVTVAAGEAVRFEPGEWQLGRNDGDERVVALAMGAPQETPDTEIRRECPDCGERTPHTISLSEDGEAVRTVCLDCEAETGRYT